MRDSIDSNGFTDKYSGLKSSTIESDLRNMAARAQNKRQL